MAPERASSRTDPKLLEQLETAREKGGPVEAVVSLRAEQGAQSLPPDRTTEISRDVLERVERKTGVSPQKVNVFSNLGSFVVAAEPPFVRELLEQPEVEAAVANRQGEPVLEPLGRPSAKQDR